jgi:hypothetical protein
MSDGDDASSGNIVGNTNGNIVAVKWHTSLTGDDAAAFADFDAAW